jgi:PAS domain S-box-containing protein
MWGVQPESESPLHPGGRHETLLSAGEHELQPGKVAAPLLLVEEPGASASDVEALLAPLGTAVIRLNPENEGLEVLLDDGDLPCIIIDARQSWRTGLAVARALRRQDRAPTPLLFLGGESCETADLLRDYLRGTVDCLLEPLHPELLRAKVEMFLELHRRERTMRAALDRTGRAEAAARESERKLHTLLGNLPGMAYRCACVPPWAFTYASEGALKLSGYRPEDFTARRVNWGDLLPPEDCTRIWKEIKAALASRSPFTFTYRIRTRTGEERWVWERGVGIYGPRGEAEALEGFITDITELRRAQQEREELHQQVEEERNHLRAILEQLPVAVHIVEAPSGRTLYANAQSEQLLGHPMFEARSVKDYVKYRAIHPDGRRYAAEEYPLSRVLATGEPQPGHEVLYDRPDGSVRVFHINAGPIRDTQGKLRAVVASFMDITALKRAERHQAFLASVSETLASSLDYEATLAHVVQRAVPDLGDGCTLDLLEPDGSIRRLAASHVDPARAELSWALARHHPLRLEEPYGSGAVISTGRTELAADITDEMLVQYASDPEHLELLRKTRVTSSLTVPLHARGRTFGALCFFYCREGYPRAVHRYDQDAQVLAEDVARRAALAVDNARLYREAHLAVRLRDEFLSVASHELKTPLTPLNLTLTTLSRELQERDGEAQAERLHRYLQVARRQVMKLSMLISALFDVSRISQGKLTLELTEVDLGEVLGEVVAWFAPEAARVGSELRVEGAARVSGRWDRLRLEQVITNLLSNAIRYGAGRPIHARVEVEGELARLVVRDEGIGIAPEALERIFGKFERAVSDRHYGGLGLGLYITRSIVEALGGSVQVESRPGEGATFSVELPRSGPPDAQR